MDNENWRSAWSQDRRRFIVDFIMVSFQVYLEARPTFRVVRGDLRTLALRIEDKNFLAATAESDYFVRIATRLLAITRVRATGTPMAQAADIDMAQYTVNEDAGLLITRLYRNGSEVDSWAFSAEPEQRQSDLAQTLQDWPAAIAIESSTGDRTVVFLLGR